jgi:hypothetical protein
MVFRRFYQFITTLVAIAIVLVIGVGYFAVNVSKLKGISGEHVYYLDSPSSQGLRKEQLSWTDIFRVEGESVRFARTTETEKDLVARIRDTYGAKVLFSEKVAGVTSYYCYTNDWGNGVELGGVTVNLHIAVSDSVCVVGTPIIFDGF